MGGRKVKRILLAESPDAMPLAFESFGVRDTDVPLVGTGENGTICQLVPCTSLAAAESILRHDIDLIVCGLEFDESRMFDLLRKVKAEAATCSIPFLCVKSRLGPLDRTIHESIEIAARTLGGEGFYDLSAQRKLLGEGAAIRQIGTYIYRLVSDDSVSFRQH
jgi:hypothetical protein